MMKTKQSKFVLFRCKHCIVEIIKDRLLKDIYFEGVDFSTLDYPKAIISYYKEQGEYINEYSKQQMTDLIKIEIKNK